MVLQHAHSFGGSALRLDTARIAAGAGAIALNVTVLLLLLVPAGLPSLTPPADRVITVIPIDRTKPPVPPTPPVEVEVVRQDRTVTRVPTVPDIVQPVVDEVLIDEGSLPADETIVAPADAGPVDIAPSSGPVSGVRLEYARAPSPPYPREALIDGLQGTVLLQVLVDVDGRPLQVDVQKSSGHRKLDDAARRFVLKHWTFRPAMKNGQPVQAIGIVPIAFNLG